MTHSSDQDAGKSVFLADAQDERRLDALRDYEILDPTPEDSFDRLTRLAADLFGVEVAFVAFLNTDRQRLKSSVGLNRAESTLAASFCTHTIESDGALVIEDASDDERTESSPFATEAGLRFYAGVPIQTPDEVAIGTFSIMGSEPRSFSDEETRRLVDLAEMAGEALSRRRKARKHKEMAQRFEAILEDSNMLMGVLAPDGTLLEANETALQYIEESEDEVLGTAFWKTPWWPETMQDEIRARVDRAAGGEYVEYEADLESPGGRPYSIEGTIRPVGGADETVDALVVSARDVTERKEVEETLRKTRRFYEQVLEQVPIDLAVFTPDAEFAYINPQSVNDAERREWLIGHTNEEYCRERGLDPDIGRRRDEMIRKTAKDEILTEVEETLQTESGPRHYLRVHGPITNVDGQVTHVAGFGLDITEQKKREQDLRRSEERWRSLLEHLRSGVHVTVGGTIEYVNPAGTDILGAEDPEEILGHNSLDFIPEDAEIDVETRLGSLERGDPTEPVEYEIARLDGTRRLVQVYSVPIEIGEKQGRQTVFRDVTEERRAQRQLREREERIRGLANSIPGVTYQFYAHPDGTYGCHFVSDHAEDLLGIASDPDTFFEQFVEQVPTSVREDLLRSVDEAVEKEQLWRYEVPFERPDGEQIWLSGASSPVRRERSSGEELVFNGVLLDVTERKRAHRRMERYREYTDRLLDASDDLFFVCDRDGTLQRWNERFASVTGYSEEELSEMNALHLVLDEDRAQTAETIAEVFETGRSQVEVSVLTKGGSTIPYEFTGNRVEHPDGDFRLVSIGRDVTERNRREARLRDRRQKIESLYDTTKGLLTAKRPKAVSKRIHDVITTVFDYSLSNTGFVEGKDLVPVDETTDDSEGVPSPGSQPVDGDSVAARALQTGETVIVEDVQALDNRIDYGTLQSVAAIPIAGHGVIVLGQVEKQEFDPFNIRLLEVLGTYASMVLDRLRGEEALREAKEEAEEASRLKSAMLANMSHEIRTPLTSVTGFAELLKDNLDGRMQTFAEQIYNGGMRLQRTLDSVLQLSRLEAGVYEMDRTSLSLAPLIEETVDMLRLSAEEKGLHLSVELPDDPVEGAFNEGAVNRILENLLENAIKFTPDGGTIEIRAYSNGNDAVLEVEDTGVGISEEALPEIFGAFQQESEGLAREYEGSGLGLSIVQRLAESHGGTVEVDTEKGVGTRFTVRLPRSTPDAE